jgi:hypothetical protein
MVDQRQKAEGWGTDVIPRLAADIRNELPEIEGFSERNFGRMIAFYREYHDVIIVQQVVAQLSGQASIGAQPVPQFNETPEDELLPQVAAQLSGQAPNGAQLVPKLNETPEAEFLPQSVVKYAVYMLGNIVRTKSPLYPAGRMV